MQNRSFNTTAWIQFAFWTFMLLHLAGWTLTPALVRYNLPLDAIEGTAWGHQLEWGYDKNPFLNGWLTALATYLSGASGWMVYLFSQLSVVACFYAIFKLAQRMLNDTYALIAVLILEVIQYYNFHAIDFNDNTLELGLWALTIYCFYCAIQSTRWIPQTSRRTTETQTHCDVTKQSIALWLLTGFFAALGVMAKYYTLALLAALFLFLITDKSTRSILRTWPPYLGLALFIAILLPHALWLTHHDFITVRYVFQRTNSLPTLSNHFYFPAQFAWQQFEAFLPGLILFSFLFIKKSPRINRDASRLNTFDQRFLYFAALGPFILTLLLSLISGAKLRAGWGMPIQSFWGILLISLIPPVITRKRLIIFYVSTLALMFLLLCGYSYSLINSKDTSSANFPGQEVANTITKKWHDAYHTQLTYVAGSRWIGGNIEFYSKDHPSVYMEWDNQHSSWIDENDLRKKGAVFVWDMSEHESLPNDVKARFPQLKQTEIISFNWKRNHANLPPTQLGIALLPPTK